MKKTRTLIACFLVAIFCMTCTAQMTAFADEYDNYIGSWIYDANTGREISGQWAVPGTTWRQLSGYNDEFVCTYNEGDDLYYNYYGAYYPIFEKNTHNRVNADDPLKECGYIIYMN